MLKDELINKFREREPEVLALENWTEEELAGYWLLQDNHSIEDFDNIPCGCNCFPDDDFRHNVRKLVKKALEN